MSDQSAVSDTGRQRHPLVHVGTVLLSDLLSTLTFVALYALTGSILLATGLAIVLGISQIGWQTYRRRPIDSIQWLTLGLVVVLGSATLLTRDPVFVMVKPTLIYAALGVVMLRRGWLTRYCPPIALSVATDTMILFGYIWSALMFVTAIANLAVAVFAEPVTWAWFVGVFPITSKIVLVGIQYGCTRTIVRRRIRAARLAA
jgi:intracellular septation protein A